MRSGDIPLQFEIDNVLRGLVRSADGRPSALLLSLPFVNVRFCPSTLEKEAAAQIVVRACDRRVLSAQECCDSCIDDALRSLQELRSELIDTRVALLSERDGALYQLLELMLVAIRQFLTFQQHLSLQHVPRTEQMDGQLRLPEDRQIYFDALELLRGHLSRCLGQIAVIAGMNLPSDGLVAGYQGAWELGAYKPVNAVKVNV